MLNIGSITTSVIIRGNGATNNAETNASFNKCFPKASAILHGLSLFPFKKLSVILHVNQIALNAMDSGIISFPRELYNFGSILDNSVNMSEKISHVQQVEKNSIDSATLTGEKYLYVAPTSVAAAVNPSVHNKGIAPAPNGRNDKNIIQNFFNGFIVFLLYHIL
jgi:hypothetical protein